MTPLAHAVGFVDDEAGYWAREQVLEESAVLEALRGEIEDLAVAFLDKSMRLPGFRCREMRVHRY